MMRAAGAKSTTGKEPPRAVDCFYEDFKKAHFIINPAGNAWAEIWKRMMRWQIAW
jgi:hypothetical protein